MSLIKLSSDKIIHINDIKSAERLGETLSIKLWSEPEIDYRVSDPNQDIFSTITKTHEAITARFKRGEHP